MSKIDHFMLEGHELVPIEVWKDGEMDHKALLKWAKWFESAERHVMDTKLIDGSRISTVFLGLDHAFGGGAPMLFETALIAGEQEFCPLLGRMYRPIEVVARYATWGEAEEGHMQWIERCVPPNMIEATAREKAA